jgi:hypothetical protein
VQAWSSAHLGECARNKGQRFSTANCSNSSRRTYMAGTDHMHLNTMQMIRPHHLLPVSMYPATGQRQCIPAHNQSTLDLCLFAAIHDKATICPLGKARKQAILCVGERLAAHRGRK